MFQLEPLYRFSRDEGHSVVFLGWFRAVFQPFGGRGPAAAGHAPRPVLALVPLVFFLFSELTVIGF